MSVLDQFTPNFSNHVMTERLSRSFHFKQAMPGDQYHYAFSLTWTPGMLILDGDLGQMTISHWSAMKSFDNMLGWINGSSVDYLFEKAGVEMVYDAVGTAKEMVAVANREALPSLRGLRDRRREEWLPDRPIHGELNADYEKWLKARPELQLTCETDRSGRRFNDKWIVPRGWEMWQILLNAFSPHYGDGEIFDAVIRRDIANDIEQFFYDHDTTACGAIVYEHELPSATMWADRDLRKMAAIKFGVAMMTKEVPRAE